MEKIKARISRLTTKQKKGLIIAAIAAGGFLAVFLPIMVMMNNPENKPIPLTLSPSVDYVNNSFSFQNDSRAISFEVSIPAQRVVNITVRNNNGTQLRLGASRVQPQSQCGFSMDLCVPVFATTLFPGSTPYAPSVQSFIFTALVDTKLCLSVLGVAYDTAIAKVTRWSEAGGFIEVQDTGLYNATTLAQNQNSIENVNITIADTMEYYKEFSVATSGYYLINSSAIATQGSNPDTLVQVLLKGTGPASDIPDSGYRISGAAREIARLDHAGAPPSSHYTVAYLESGKTYILRYSQHGFVNYVRWDLIKTVQGSVGTSGMTLDFTVPSSTATVYRQGTARALMFVDFGTALRYNTLYDINFSGDPYPGRLGVGFGVGDNAWQLPFETASNYQMNGHHGRIMFLEDTCEPITKDGQQLTRNPAYIRMYHITTYWSNYSVTPAWDANTLNREWFMQHQIVAVWFTDAGIYPLPTSVHLSVSERSGGVPSFPGNPSADKFNTTLTFRNDGAEVDNGVGVYKIAGHKDSEIQIQFPEMQNLYNPTPTFNFYTAKGTRGAYTASGTTSISFTNITRTWGGVDNGAVGVDWDAPCVFEVGIMEDPMYVLFTGTYSATAVSNVTTFTMSYKYEPFLNLNQPFTISRDNRLQIFRPIALPASGLIQSYVDYGSCCNYASGSAFIVSTCSCLAITYVGASWSYMATGPNPKAWPGSPVAYVIWRRSNMADAGAANQYNGMIMRINVWSGAPVDWLAWGCFIGAAAGLAVVGLMFWKHKIIRVR